MASRTVTPQQANRTPMAVRTKQVATKLARSAAFRAETLRRAKLVKTR